MAADLASVSPRNPALEARHLHPAALPRWRALLESHWRHRLELLTRFSLAYHDAEAAATDPHLSHSARRAARVHSDWLLRRTVAERQALAEVEAALSRVAAGRFGWCELCGAAMPAERLAELPQARYCAGCTAGPARPAARAATARPVAPAARAATARPTGVIASSGPAARPPASHEGAARRPGPRPLLAVTGPTG